MRCRRVEFSFLRAPQGKFTAGVLRPLHSWRHWQFEEFENQRRPLKEGRSRNTGGKVDLESNTSPILSSRVKQSIKTKWKMSISVINFENVVIFGRNVEKHLRNQAHLQWVNGKRKDTSRQLTILTSTNCNMKQNKCSEKNNLSKCQEVCWQSLITWTIKNNFPVTKQPSCKFSC